ncbi:MAG: TonB-dependent receptor plug domain-containing protein, partial [Bacteroidota bacterium]
KFEQSIKEAPSTISLVTRDQIFKYGWVSGNDVLFRLPGFSMSQDYDRTTASSRGIYEGWNNNHMLMLIDGIPMNDNMYGTAFTWEIMPLLFTKSLEVIRGPGSALYGSNAMNGVISYNTLSAKDLTKKTEIRYRLGSYATHILDLITAGENESVSYVSAFNFFRTNGDTYNSFDANASQLHPISRDRSSFYFFNKIEGKDKLNGWSLHYHEQAWNFNTGHGWLFYVPDKPENMNESRRLISLRYKTPQVEKALQQEYLVRYQRHGVDWNVRLFPDNTAGYPFGLTELLKTHTSDLFSRLQFTYSGNSKSVILGGLENSVFLYDGDDLHLSNANLNSDFLPTSNNELVNVGDYFSWIDTKPFINTGVYFQYTASTANEKLSATLGLRYDYSTFNFSALDEPGVPEESKSFDKLSPRLSLVYSATDKLTLKLMGGRAFRTPAASELFGSNTFLLASNIRKLRPEVVTTFELASDFTITENINWRFNAFRTEFNDQIAYSVSNFNLSTNLYSLTSLGFENELIFQVSNFDGFFNYSFVQRQDEEIVDPTIALSKSDLTWVPQHIVNLGLKYSRPKYHLALQTHYQGAVQRRTSDRDPAFDAVRGKDVSSWITFDLRMNFKLTEGLDIGLIGTNITGENGKLLKNNIYAFDYQIPSRSILLDIRLML